MARSEQHWKWNRGMDGWAAIAAFAIALLMIVVATQLHAQTFTVLHSFGGVGDGYEPLAGVTIDGAGNLYGTTAFGGTGTFEGIAFKLAPKGSSWIYSRLHNFSGGDDGGIPIAKLVIGRDGSLYGTATTGGAGIDYGTVFNLRPSPNRCATVQCPWGATNLHSFFGYDGEGPTTINFDSAGNIYGTTQQGGSASVGVVYKLTASSGSWTYSMLTDFAGSGIAFPNSGVIADAAGNVYGTTGNNPGSVFEVTASDDLQILHRFIGGAGGLDAFDGLVSDPAGNLYGMTAFDGPHSGGTVFAMSPSSGGWIFNTIYGFQGGSWDGTLGVASMTMDAQGNLYGTTPRNGAFNHGTVFKLAPSSGGWIYTDLHDFTGGDDGCTPWSDVVMDSRGNLYGTTSGCGAIDPAEGGTVWEITP